MSNLPKLPELLHRKIYKTGQTRGADDDVIYQNRVSRNSTVLIPLNEWKHIHAFGHIDFDNGYIVLLPLGLQRESELRQLNLTLGENCLYFYETRQEWELYNPSKRQWHFATSRIAPLGGQYVARIPATTAREDGGKINLGFTDTKSKGAGIRWYEYASASTIEQCRLQLEAIYWHCFDAEEAVIKAGMSQNNARTRQQRILQKCKETGLLDYEKLIQARILNSAHQTVCPLCLEPISGKGFMTRIAQAEGREIPDLTITEVSLFHIVELRSGEFNHRPYNLGWGHHHCNVVAKDAGIMPTLIWLKSLLDRNLKNGVKIPAPPKDQ
ncbi:MAG: BstXI family restriction endonuclease [Victivallales bacterium]|nr:BstXI family restriction endonuclease [Victivallales bacterium]